jgi:enterochelin esterase-like enzyme
MITRVVYGGIFACVGLVMMFSLPQGILAACTEVNGTTTRHDYYADDIQTRMYYTVYTPPCYSTHDAENYPVIYLMHGSNDDDNHWLRLGLADVLDEGIVGGTIPPVIAVLPFGEWIANENRFDGASWDRIFINQVMPMVESQYRINGNRATRAIGGISRGGFWAYHLAFRYPALFGAVGGHSAFFDRYHARPEYNPLDLALNAPFVDRMRIWLDRGRDDYAYPGLDIMDERLAERGLDYTYNVYPQGQHSNDYWRSHVAEYVDFYVSAWPLPESPVVQITPTPTPPAPTADDEAVYLLLPVVAFPSLQTNIPRDVLNTVIGGFLNTDIVLTESVVDQLAALNIHVAVGTRIVPDDALYNVLWRDGRAFTLMPFDQLQPRYRVLTMDEVHPLDDVLNYPFAFVTDTPNYEPEKLTRLLMSGVTALTRQSIAPLDANGVEWAASGILPYVQSADFFHTSNEVSIVPDCPTPNLVGLGGNASFCSKAEHFALFNVLGLDIVELSGNHNNDYGYQAYLDTFLWYRENGMMTLGGGETLAEAREPVIIEHHGNSVSMLACNWVGPYYALVNENPALLGGVRPGAAECERSWLREVLPQLQAEHDLVVVTVQYLEVDQYAPTDQARIDFRTLVDWGADVVIGTSSHFPQSFEFYRPEAERETFIHYGLGNLFFDQQFFAGRRFFMDQLYIYDGRLLFVDLFTGIIDDQARPRPMTADERENFLFIIMVQHGSF